MRKFSSMSELFLGCLATIQEMRTITNSLHEQEINKCAETLLGITFQDFIHFLSFHISEAKKAGKCKILGVEMCGSSHDDIPVTEPKFQFKDSYCARKTKAFLKNPFSNT